MPIVFAFVLGLAFLLLLVIFRSIVIPIKSIALNLLSVGASYGGGTGRDAERVARQIASRPTCPDQVIIWNGRVDELTT